MASAVKSPKRRLSKLVNAAGVVAFTWDDFFLVSSSVTQDPSRLVLVGGQALEAWGVFLGVLAPTGDQHPLTEDTDWLGSARDAEWLGKLLGTQRAIEIQKPQLGDASSNTAIMYLEGAEGGVLWMDFLSSVTGLTDQEITKYAVQVDIPAKDLASSGVSIRVLHPIHCLASRMANLETHEKKRRGNGPMQAQWAVDIVAAFLVAMVASRDERQVRRACEMVAELAEFKSGRYCFFAYGIDPLVAVSPEVVTAGGARFASDDWPRTLARIDRKRQRWALIDEQRSAKKASS